jgi:ABC-2 type transport system ATP-binding protein
VTRTTRNLAIAADQLTKLFDSFTAVDGVSFEVDRGSIFGFLGPNGAGKTTTILMLITLLKPTNGSAIVGGHDLLHEPGKVRSAIGYASQDIAVDEYLTGRENLIVQGHLYHLGGNQLKERVAEALKMVDLTDRANEQVSHYSGGMRKRLDIAGALLHRPQVLFLDEPTLGLDLQTRSNIWEYISRLRNEFGITIFLTTHYMEEADSLCDTVAIIDHGQIKVTGNPGSLRASLGGDVIQVKSSGLTLDLVDKFTGLLRAVPAVKNVRQENGSFLITATSAEQTIPEVFDAANQLGVKIDGISAKQPSLDDVFLTYTGRTLRDDEANAWTGRQTLERFRRARA